MSIEKLEDKRLMAAEIINGLVSSRPLDKENNNDGFLLSYLANSGHERGGWIQSISPSDVNTVDSVLGFDISSNFITTQDLTVVDSDGLHGKRLEPGRPANDIEIDYDFANQIFANAGLSVINSREYSSIDMLVPLPFSNDRKFNQLSDPKRILARSPFTASESNIPVYYVKNDMLLNSRGLAVAQHASFFNDHGGKPGIFISSDNSSQIGIRGHSTLAHELVHMLLGSATGGANADGIEYQLLGAILGHSPNPYDIIANASGFAAQSSPESKERISDSGIHKNYVPQYVGWYPKGPELELLIPKPVGVFNNPVYLDSDKSETMNLNEFPIPQIDGLFKSRYLKSTSTSGFADQLDGKYLEDNKSLENTSADETKTPNSDAMIFHSNNRFNVIDVYSIIARFADNDQGKNGVWGRQESAIDYTVRFATSKNEANVYDWTNPIEPGEIFTEGYDASIDYDNFTGRYHAPDGREFHYVMIEAKSRAFKSTRDPATDGNAQIDAIKAVWVPNVKATSLNTGALKPSIENGKIILSDNTTYEIDFTKLIFEYTVEAGHLPEGEILKFDLRPMVNGVLLDDVLQTVEIPHFMDKLDPATGQLFLDEYGNFIEDTEDMYALGDHTFWFEVDMTDIEKDYRLVAFLDPDNDITETDESDNVSGWVYGLFLDPNSGILYYHGSDSSGSGEDHVDISIMLMRGDDAGDPNDDYWAYVLDLDFTYFSPLYEFPIDSISEFHARLHGADDSLIGSSMRAIGPGILPYNLNYGFDKPVWGFGGDGNDRLWGGIGQDILYGGNGFDNIITDERMSGWFGWAGVPDYNYPINHDIVYATDEEQVIWEDIEGWSSSVVIDGSDQLHTFYDTGEIQTFANPSTATTGDSFTATVEDVINSDGDLVDLIIDGTLAPGAMVTIVKNLDGTVTITKSEAGDFTLDNVSDPSVPVVFEVLEGEAVIDAATGTYDSGTIDSNWDIIVGNTIGGASASVRFVQRPLVHSIELRATGTVIDDNSAGSTARLYEITWVELPSTEISQTETVVLGGELGVGSVLTYSLIDVSTSARWQIVKSGTGVTTVDLFTNFLVPVSLEIDKGALSLDTAVGYGPFNEYEYDEVNDEIDVTVNDGQQNWDILVKGQATYTSGQEPKLAYDISQAFNSLEVETGAKAVSTINEGYGGSLFLKDLNLHLTGGATGSPAAVLDLNASDLVLEYTGTSPLMTIRDLIKLGRADTNQVGAWAGKGITSSAANADPTYYQLGYAQNSLLPLGAYTDFDGLAIDGSTILVKYTRGGDATLDGFVSEDDYDIVSTNYDPSYNPTTSGPRHWFEGDFTYNGIVNSQDDELLSTTFDADAPTFDETTDKGILSYDGITNYENSNVPKFTGTVPAGSFVQLYADGVKVSGSTAKQQLGSTDTEYTLYAPNLTPKTTPYEFTIRISESESVSETLWSEHSSSTYIIIHTNSSNTVTYSWNEDDVELVVGTTTIKVNVEADSSNPVIFTLTPGTTPIITQSSTGNAAKVTITDVSDLSQAVIYKTTRGTTIINAELSDSSNNKWEIIAGTPATAGQTSKIVFDNPTQHSQTISSFERIIYTQRIRKLTIQAGAIVEVSNKYYVDSSNTGYNRLSGSLFIGDSTTGTALTMYSASSGFADSVLKLNNNDLVVYSDASNNASLQLTIRSYIKNWLKNTAGPEIQAIDSSSGITGHASLNNALVGFSNFDDVALSGNYQVIIKYTYLGDADLDGDSDNNDLGIWSTNFSGDLGGGVWATRSWVLGDWDHDGDVDMNDLGLWAVTFTGDLGYGENGLAWET